MKIVAAKQGRTWVDAGELTTSYRVRVTGTREVPLDLAGLWRRSGACPSKHSYTERPIGFSAKRAAGPFDAVGTTGGPDVVLGREYVLCTYVTSPYLEDPIAVARRVVDPKTRPLLEGRPGVGADGLPARRLTCRPGDWAAYPRRIRYSFAWYRDGRRIARGRTISVGRRARGHRFACEVTARNAVGSTRKRSPSYRP